MLTTFTRQAPDKAFVTGILDWPLVRHTEEEMRERFSESNFEQQAVKALEGRTGLILHAQCRRH